MDDAIRKALKKVRELRLEVDRLEQFIRTYEELSGSSIPRDEMTSSVNNEDNPQHSLNNLEQAKPGKRRNNIKRLLDISERLIKEAGRPLTRTEIADGMERLNVTVHAANAAKYLGTLLWRNDVRFVSVGDGYLTKAMYEDHRRAEIAADHVGDDDVDFSEVF